MTLDKIREGDNMNMLIIIMQGGGMGGTPASN